jgi:hypothetical protein
MGTVPNVKRIRTEDFDSEYQALIERLAYSINTFMDDTIKLLNGNIDFTNLNQSIMAINVKTDNNKNLIEKPQINSNLKSKIQGIICIKANNVKNSMEYPNATPFITYTIKSTGIIEILHVAGLPADSEFKLTIMLIG